LLTVTLLTCFYQGDAPAAPPLAISSSYSRATPEQKPRDSQLNHIEADQLDSESDEDDLSIPPGVILVTTPIEDLSRKADNPDERTSIIDRKPSSNPDPVEHNFSRAVLSTGITGRTSVAREPGLTHSPKKLSVKTPAPKLTRPPLSSKGPLPSPQKLPHSGLSPQSTFSWDRGSPDRPSSSPSLTDNRKFSAQQVASQSSPRSNTRFSRHMARSAPDIQILSLDDPN